MNPVKPPRPHLLAAVGGGGGCGSWTMKFSQVLTYIRGVDRSAHLRLTLVQSKMWMLFFLSALLGALGSEELPSGAARQLQALHCPSCERVHCSSRRALKLQCKGGVTTGVCGCCPVCARTEGETCGGTWDYLGKCDEGLVCVYQDAASDKPEEERKGICKAGEVISSHLSINR